MPRFFVTTRAIADGRVRIGGADAVHLVRSLRVRPGERLVVADDRSREYGVVVDEVLGDEVRGTIVWERPRTGEPEHPILVLLAPTPRIDDAIAALSCVGAAEIRPVLTERTVVRPEAERARRRRERWETIAREAAGLAGRGAPPAVGDLRSLAEAVAALPPDHRLVVLDPRAPTSLLEVAAEAANAPLALVVGPEGGFGPGDRAVLSQAGATAAHLGPRVLPTQLAAAAAVLVALAVTGDLDRPVAGWPDSVGASAAVRSGPERERASFHASRAPTQP